MSYTTLAILIAIGSFVIFGGLSIIIFKNTDVEMVTDTLTGQSDATGCMGLGCGTLFLILGLGIPAWLIYSIVTYHGQIP